MKNTRLLTGLITVMLSLSLHAVDQVRLVTDRSLELLSGNEGLEELCLTSTLISDEGMKALAKFRHLRRVDLQSTNVTDEGLQRLRACKSLKRLSVNSTKITEEGAKGFNEILPMCKIVFAPDDIGG